MILIINKYVTCLTVDFYEKATSLEIFINNNLNKGYLKFIKITYVLLILIKFILIDFNYENSIKTHVKKLFNAINEQILIILENVILPADENFPNSFNVFYERYKKVSKNHKIKKLKDVANILYKNLDIPVNTIKQFSKYLFFT